MSKTTNALPSLAVVIDPIRLSDMFFNHSHDHFDGLMRDGKDDIPSQAAQFTALTLDAAEFLSYLTGQRPDDIAKQAWATLLAEDFLERL